MMARFICLCLVFGLGLCADYAIASRGIIRVKSGLDGKRLHKEFVKGTNFALIIGINEYKHHKDLTTAVNDAEGVVRLLQDKYFFDQENIITLRDRKATKALIMKELRDLVALKVKKGDNVFIYYAGHGWFDDILEAGYWVTTEATENPASFLENNTVYKFIAALDRKGVQHVLLVSDSCFSGSFAQNHRAIETEIDDRYFKQKYSKPSRSVITSGGIEPVADGGRDGHSIFAYYFLKTLSENPHPFLSSKQLGVQVEELVTRNSKQTPIIKFIHGVGDEGGQFFFINKESRASKEASKQVETERVKLPSKGKASFEDIMKAEEAQKKAVETWNFWQEERNKEYEQVKQLEESDYLNAEQKATAWERFVSAVSADNPFSREDDRMLSHARARVSYWKNLKIASRPKATYSPSDTSFDSADSMAKEIARDGTMIAYASGVVKDTKTGLEWIAGPERNMTWDEAKSWAEGLNIAGGGWRLPTIYELRTLYEKGPGMGNMTPLLKTSGLQVWSGETKSSFLAWGFSFRVGKRLSYRSYSSLRAFAVRSRGDR